MLASCERVSASLPSATTACQAWTRVRARGQHRHRRLPRSRPPRLILRDRTQEPRVGQAHLVGELLALGSKRLKNLLIFSCDSLCRSKRRFGDYHRSCRDRGMCHGEALKAVARKRLKVIYAIMRDEVPYSA